MLKVHQLNQAYRLKQYKEIVLIIEVKKEGVYIPKWNGNEKLSEDKQIRVHHRYLAPGERQKYFYDKPMIKDKLKGKLDGKVETIQDFTGVAKATITSIENFSIKVDGKEIKIDTAKALYNTEGINSTLVSLIEVGIVASSPEVDIDFLS